MFGLTSNEGPHGNLIVALFREPWCSEVQILVCFGCVLWVGQYILYWNTIFSLENFLTSESWTSYYMLNTSLFVLGVNNVNFRSWCCQSIISFHLTPPALGWVFYSSPARAVSTQSITWAQTCLWSDQALSKSRRQISCTFLEIDFGIDKIDESFVTYQTHWSYNIVP